MSTFFRGQNANAGLVAVGRISAAEDMLVHQRFQRELLFILGMRVYVDVSMCAERCTVLPIITCIMHFAVEAENHCLRLHSVSVFIVFCSGSISPSNLVCMWPHPRLDSCAL